LGLNCPAVLETKVRSHCEDRYPAGTQAKESTMPQAAMTTAIDTDAIYRPAGWLRHTLGVRDHMLTQMLAYGRVRVLTNVGRFPVYNLSDVKKYLCEIGASDEERYQSARKPIRP
jgi:hypothetical protein